VGLVNLGFQIDEVDCVAESVICRLFQFTYNSISATSLMLFLIFENLSDRLQVHKVIISVAEVMIS
jgi:hypothetical protein